MRHEQSMETCRNCSHLTFLTPEQITTHIHAIVIAIAVDYSKGYIKQRLILELSGKKTTQQNGLHVTSPFDEFNAHVHCLIIRYLHSTDYSVSAK